MENNADELKAKIEKLEREVEYYKGLVGADCTASSGNGQPISGDGIRTGDGRPFIDYSSTGDPSLVISGLDIPFVQLEQLLIPIFDMVHHHIVFINADGIITLCNSKAAEDLGADRETVIGKHIRDLLGLPDCKINLLETLRTGKQIVNREVMDKNYGINNTMILRDSDGEVLRVAGTFQFLNGIKEAEKRGLAGRIAAGIAHEIRNPLTTVRGFLQLLHMKEDSETSSLIQNLLIPEIDRANKIITDFLRIAKPLETTEEKLEIVSFMKDYIVKFLNSEALLYNIAFSCTISDEVKGCYINGNKEEFLQVFINLFSNSFQARKDALEITIDVLKRNSYIEIKFKDNGYGIKASMIPHVFDPFFTTKDDGTGLGLSVSKKIIENHEGDMTVSSDSSGTEFTIMLPLQKR
ncbi:PAS domain-containing protein [Bacillus salacetis]|uniref:histidine kinase n=1 Tax=Bacillus salacetis TaxID=2315464 RepID=A0A3A1R6I1_9BACI|nr:ATP-binding protein [Bacillus salacetis]RIW35097.1 PAS domain-containing protein [Bacillus salacetis]